MGKKKGIPGLSFSAKRASGISALQSKLSREAGIPLSRSGRQQKFGKAMGCCFPAVALLGAAGGGLFLIAKAIPMI